MEVVLGMPVFFIILVALAHAFSFSVTRIEAVVTDRSTVWNSARNGVCLSNFDPTDVVSQFLDGVVLTGCTDISQSQFTEGDQFWSEMDQQGGRNLTTQVKQAEPHIWKRADYRVLFVRMAPQLSSNQFWSETSILAKAMFYSYDDAALASGYNGPVHDSFNLFGISNSFFPGPNGLFPGLFGQAGI
jgi:hypothetical protein